MTITAVRFKRFKDSKWEIGLHIEHDVYQILDKNANVVEELYAIDHNPIQLSINVDYIFQNGYK